MAAPALVAFTEEMNDLVERAGHPVDVAAGAAEALPGLLAGPDFLEREHRSASSEAYAQHVLYVHPAGAYSIVALVWLPGQSTPIHDHHCWCVVGVLEGEERETSYSLRRSPNGEWLDRLKAGINGHGEVSVLLPPQENIHRVENVDTGPTISIHVYGVDIAKLGTSINKVFDQQIDDSPSGEGHPVAWRSSVPN